VACANAIYAKFKVVLIILPRCGLEYILISIKCEGFLKLLSFMDGSNHQRAIERSRFTSDVA
jgi:hypothetical protein